MSFQAPPPHESFLELEALDERRKEREARQASRALATEDGVQRAPSWLGRLHTLWLRLRGRPN
jgi:hypothetical protein